MVTQSGIIQQMMLYNNQSPYTIAIIVTDKNLQYERREIVKMVASEIEKYKNGGEYAGLFPERWLPATFVLSQDPFTEQNKMINSTLKMVRSKVEEAYRDKIEFAYTPEGKNIYNKINLGEDIT